MKSNPRTEWALTFFSISLSIDCNHTYSHNLCNFYCFFLLKILYKTGNMKWLHISSKKQIWLDSIFRLLDWFTIFEAKFLPVFCPVCSVWCACLQQCQHTGTASLWCCLATQYTGCRRRCIVGGRPQNSHTAALAPEKWNQFACFRKSIKYWLFLVNYYKHQISI